MIKVAFLPKRVQPLKLLKSRNNALLARVYTQQDFVLLDPWTVEDMPLDTQTWLHTVTPS